MKNIAQKTQKTQKTDSELKVRQRLLDSAEHFFAAHGFDGTSVRDITNHAGCNVAAVNYYFSGKENLYVEVFAWKMDMLRDVRVDGINQLMETGGRTVTLEQLLTVFAELFIQPMADRDAGGRLMKLWMREIIDHRLPGRMFMDQTVKPVFAAFTEAMLKVCPGLDAADAMLCIQSVIAQLKQVICAREMFPDTDGSEIGLDDMTEAVKHIVTFSAAGIRHYAKQRA
jgi:AcrR family transcriptional regulator